MARIDQQNATGTDAAGMSTAVGHSQYFSQSYTTGRRGTVSKVRLKFAKQGLPTGNLSVFIHSDNAGQPGSLIVNGTASVVDVSTFPVWPTTEYFTFTFTTPPANANATVYHVIAKYTGGDGTNFVDIVEDATGNPYSGGNAYNSDDGSTWTTLADSDLIFEVWSEEGETAAFF